MEPLLEQYVLALFREALGLAPATEALGNSVTFTIDASKFKKPSEGTAFGRFILSNLTL